ncbi:MAG: hypothetical protein JJ966_15250 [Balneolaceae bacterium]|nr:hypothetical protein [Balneolaceae bacterium]
MKHNHYSLGLLMVIIFCSACTSLDMTTTKVDHPLMIGAQIAPDVTASEIPLIMEDYFVNDNSETTTTSGNYQINTQSSTNGIGPALRVTDERDIVFVTDWIYVGQDFFGLAFSNQYRWIYAYLRSN